MFANPLITNYCSLFFYPQITRINADCVLRSTFGVLRSAYHNRVRKLVTRNTKPATSLTSTSTFFALFFYPQITQICTDWICVLRSTFCVLHITIGFANS